MESATVLVADDDRSMAFFLTELMRGEGYRVLNAFDGPQALKMLEKETPDVALMDVRMPGLNGFEVIRRALGMDSRTQFIVITAFDARETGIEAIKVGAYDYFAKPLDKDEVRIVVKRAIRFKGLEDEIRRLKGKEGRRKRFGDLIGQSRGMQTLYDQMEMVLDTNVTVLITGESGTGKELVSEAIHYGGLRRDKPFIKFNCAAIPDTLLESELFGYERGAFTGAVERKIGKFERATGGSILLDEIGDMGPLTQAKVLRFLQERTIERLGGDERIPVDVRIMAATNKDLTQCVRDGTFREDLFYRLNVVTLQLPPLRERVEDIPVLVDHFLNHYKRLFDKEVVQASKEVMALFLRFPWPGNVRELENVIQRAVVMCKGKSLTVDMLPQYLREAPHALPFGEPSLEQGLDLSSRVAMIVDRVERDLILQALEKSGGRRLKASETLGISRKTLHNKMVKHGLLPGPDE
jgi:DNA-binding NtrC family response regulator